MPAPDAPFSKSVFDNMQFESRLDPTIERLKQEKAAAKSSMAYQLANLTMPEDIRRRARAWKLEAFVEVLWNNAFQAGYREALRSVKDSAHDLR